MAVTPPRITSPLGPRNGRFRLYFTFSNPPAGGISLSKSQSSQSTNVLPPQTWRDGDVAHALHVRFRSHCHIQKRNPSSVNLKLMQPERDRPSEECGNPDALVGRFRFRRKSEDDGEVLRIVRVRVSFSGQTITSGRYSGNGLGYPGRGRAGIQATMASKMNALMSLCI